MFELTKTNPLRVLWYVPIFVVAYVRLFYCIYVRDMQTFPVTYWMKHHHFLLKLVTVNSTVSGHWQFRATFWQTNLFIPNDVVLIYFDYPVKFPNLLAASNLMLAVKTWLTAVVITKRLATPLSGKVNVPENCLHATAQTFILTHNFSKTCTYYRYILDTLPLTNIFLILSNFFMTYLLIIWPSSRTTITGQLYGLSQKYGYLVTTILK